MKASNSILLIQPRHIYAPEFSESQLGHIYLPTSLIAAGSIFLDLGIDIEIRDENIEEVKHYTNNVGINLLGAPYIPKVNHYEEILKSKFSNDYKLFIGGQIVDGLNNYDFSRLFSNNVINGNNVAIIAKAFNIPSQPLPDITKLSFVDTFELLPSGYLKAYLKDEIGFYLSQGCKHSCSFCSATRTKTINGELIKASEIYRDLTVALNDLNYLVKKSKEFGYSKLKIYLSNLDLFQTPLKLMEFALGVIQIKKQNQFEIIFRGLSTVASFLYVHKKFPKVITTIKEAGLTQIGFGIDGATPQVYKLTRKPQKIKMCLDAIEISKEIYNIIPETLMVFGHNGKEDESSLQKAVEFSKTMLAKFGALPRPHIAKDIVPGNDGWNDNRNAIVREKFYNNVSLFQNLDFTALPSSITHPDKEFRSIVTKYYSQICALPNSLTKFVLPEDSTLAIGEIEKIKNFNKGRYDL